MNLDKTLEYTLNLLHINRGLFEEYIEADNQEIFFTKSDIKKRGGRRTIYEPLGDSLQAAYKAIYEALKPYRCQVHDAAHGFLNDRSNVTNARAHLGARFSATIDIQDFFGSITTELVRVSFLRLGLRDEVADALSKFCTINGHLPQGLNSSPDISNHCLYELDVQLAAYASKFKVKYTRYVDDMTFSGRVRTDESGFSIREAIDIVENTGSFRVATNKTKIQKRGANQYVTGLTIFDDKMPRVSKKYKRRLRLELYLIDKFGIDMFLINSGSVETEPENRNTTEYRQWREKLNNMGSEKLSLIEGRLNYIHGVEPTVSSRLHPILRRIYEQRKLQQESEGD